MSYKRNRFDLYKDHYFHEFDLKDRLDKSLSVHITVLTASIAALFYILEKMDFSSNFIYCIIFVLWIIALFLCYIGGWYLIKAYLSSRYKHIPYLDDLDEYSSQTNNSNIEQELSPDCIDHLTKEYAKNTSINAKENEKKSKYTHKAKTFLIPAICILSILAVSITIFSKFS